MFAVGANCVRPAIAADVAVFDFALHFCVVFVGADTIRPQNSSRRFGETPRAASPTCLWLMHYNTANFALPGGRYFFARTKK